MEHPRYRSGFTHIPAVLREDVTDLAYRAIPIIGDYIDNHRNAARPITFVLKFVELTAFEFACSLLDRAFDVVRRHVQLFCVGYCFAETRVTVGIATPNSCGNGDFFDHLREHPSTFGVNSAFLMFNTVPL